MDTREPRLAREAGVSTFPRHQRRGPHPLRPVAVVVAAFEGRTIAAAAVVLGVSHQRASQIARSYGIRWERGQRPSPRKNRG